MINIRLRRGIPFFKVLLTVKDKKGMLNTFPNYVLDDIVEILYNIIHGNIQVTKKAAGVLKKQKHMLLSISKSKSGAGRRRMFYKQTGGFIGAVIPIIAGLLASAL